MKLTPNKVLLTLILLGSGILLYEGWKLFWFLTDDAFIAFRYVSNSVLGYGYTWNPPPFRPVEGYTSFLWVVILDFIWRVFGVQPPSIVNYLSLGFSCLTLALVAWSVMRMKLNPDFDRFRLGFLCLVLIAVLTNRTFLAWTSSGMETAMFNFLFTLWIVLALNDRNRNYGWLFSLTGTAALVYLARPDGIIVVICTLWILFFWARARLKQARANIKLILSIFPLVVVPLHLLWRKSYYGEWLPNTYYAKFVAPWPQAGIRYLASFVLEYALWIWLFLFFAFAVSVVKGWYKVRHNKNRPSNKNRKTIPTSSPSASFSAGAAFAILTVVIQLGYYTFMVGGDHFEYRVYSYLIPLIFLSFLWLLHALNFSCNTAVAAFGMFFLFSLPIPWTHWLMTRNKNTRPDTHIMIVPVSGKLPSFVRAYTGTFDDLQDWLINHHICMRHQEHKIFYEYHKSLYPSRAEGEKIPDDGYPVLASGTVGVPGWVLPHVNIIDEGGLNDYVIARSPVRKPERLMAHDRVPPPGYVESFHPNILISRSGQIVFRPNRQELTAANIRAIEARWATLVKRMRIVSGGNLGSILNGRP